MDIRKFILQKLAENEEIKTAEIIKASGFSREYVNRFLKALQKEGKIVRIGKANKTKYVKAQKSALIKSRKQIRSINLRLHSRNLSEDTILDKIKAETGVFLGIAKNIESIASYAFTEMLNNAIEHSRSQNIIAKIEKNADSIQFEINDQGIGIFNNITQKKKLKNHLEAIQDLLKGKQSTAPKEHSGEGIFFTSKAADVLTVQSSQKRLIFNNIINDIFIHDVKNTPGTRISFKISLTSKQNLDEIFKKYSVGLYDFGRTKIVVKLFAIDTDYISRSQARRIISGLEKFQQIILDFKGVKTIGQAFVDEIFRVWQSRFPQIKISRQNANENIEFMIKRTRR